MKRANKVPAAVIRRLPHYLRILEELHGRGVERISSGELSERIGYTASQIRQDFNHFGGFGQQGYGYNVESLREETRGILGLTREYDIAVVGCGRLGHAIAYFTNSFESTFVIKGIFDISPEIIGDEILGVVVQNVSELPEYLKNNRIDIGVITVPKESAQEIADILTAGGAGGIWNFAPMDLELPEAFPVCNVHLFDGLQSLVYYINHTG